MEILDGQHRLLAAKMIGVEIYYQVEEKLEIKDLLHINLMKAWKPDDYLNFHIKNGNENYIKFKEFYQKNKITLFIAHAMCFGRGHGHWKKFHKGDMIFQEAVCENIIFICKASIEIIKKDIGSASLLSTVRFWQALICLVKHPEFDHDHWIKNISKMASRVVVKASFNDYLFLFENIYNYHARTKIHLKGH